MAKYRSMIDPVLAGYRAGLVEQRAVTSVGGWIVGLAVRSATDLAFFALIAWYMGAGHALSFVVFGRSLFLGATQTLFVIQEMGTERLAGMGRELSRNQSRGFFSQIGRSMQWVPTATLTSIILLAVTVPVWITEPNWTLLTLLIWIPLVSVSGATVAIAVGVWALLVPDMRVLLGTLTGLTLATITGVVFPIEVLPDFLQLVARAFALTWAVEGARDAVRGVSLGMQACTFAICSLCTIGWILSARIAWRYVVTRVAD